MTELPDSIGNLKNLVHFQCNRNQLTSEYFVPSLPQYAVLKTEHPEMSELPESIGNLKNLKKFFCHENNLTSEYFIPSSPNETQYTVADLA